ncbi:hypothetical protein B296_00023448 [Ensete ventricosum]|uniref:Uncharacterized protein n=1 Tax=Ensete ventricosum TaxID=4639 RepID=A0A427A1L9_ENSVE|nr:hypothetical protein B296_00023448 [Ensete ventricosum]
MQEALYPFANQSDSLTPNSNPLCSKTDIVPARRHHRARGSWTRERLRSPSPPPASPPSLAASFRFPAKKMEQESSRNEARSLLSTIFPSAASSSSSPHANPHSKKLRCQEEQATDAKSKDLKKEAKKELFSPMLPPPLGRGQRLADKCSLVLPISSFAVLSHKAESLLALLPSHLLVQGRCPCFVGTHTERMLSREYFVSFVSLTMLMWTFSAV